MASDETRVSQAGADSSDLSDLPDYDAAIVDLLGAVALGELLAFEQLAADAQMAPTLADKAALARMGVTEFRHFERLVVRLRELGADPFAAMAAFVPAIQGFHERTPPADWLEGLVKAYVGDSIANDFFREVAALVDPTTRQLLIDVLSDAGQAEFAVPVLRAAMAADPSVSGRLALWARRLVGEALSQAQRVAAQRGTLAALVVGALPVGGASTSSPLTEFSRMLSRITEAHTRRMRALDLAP